MGTRDEEAITLRREVHGRDQRGGLMAVAALCALAGTALGFGMGLTAAPEPGRAAEVRVVRHHGLVYEPSPCQRDHARVILLQHGADAVELDDRER